MKKFIYFKAITILLTLFIYNQAYSLKEHIQADTVLAPNISEIPIVNGNGDDQCWQNVPWQTIDQVWIPYDSEVDSNDYSGHYKIVWSSSTNLLYILIEVSDDEFVDGFISGQTPDEYNFDITEVFIDENASGRLHIFDAVGNDTLQFGSNAENAFTYHIYADFPDEGGTTTEHYVGDLDGTGWGNVRRPDYASHLPEFVLRKTGSISVWEFSLIVYDDTYEDNNIDPARVQLEIGKIIGLSVAYCDNDDPDGQRDNMFGSVWEPDPGNL
ncbi:MAG TPA: sugar-binding protein, partial [Ignavibacteriaceae bacterium]|nr:sugar-binding protein [Ignavibacteriaceae bacterium]